MIKLGSWARVIITWVVISSNLLLSYIALRYPSDKLEMLSLLLNFFATTSLFYIYMSIHQDVEELGEEEAKPVTTEEQTPFFLYKLNFGALIEDLSVWFSLFFVLYNIVPITLWVHNIVAKNL